MQSTIGVRDPTFWVDVLEQVPQDVVLASFWYHLHSDQCRANVRLASRRSLHLANDLITWSHFDFQLPGAAGGGTAAGAGEFTLIAAAAAPLYDATEATTAPTAGASPPWLLAAQQWFAFASHLPQLVSLQLSSWPDVAALMAALPLLSAATHARVQRLRLSQGSALPPGAGEAVQQAFPHLQELIISGDRPRLSGPFFHPFHASTTLTQLVILDDCEVSHAAMLSLSHLTSLRRLSVSSAHTITAQHLAALAPLTRLDTLSLRSADAHHRWSAPSLRCLAPLFTLTSLTALRLPWLREADPDPASADGHRPPSVLPPPPLGLRNLVRLQSLFFTSGFVLKDEVWADLVHLTQLQVLKLGGFALSGGAPPGAGHLPCLRHLMVWDHQRPAGLLRALLPFLPLPSLTSLDSTMGRVALDVRTSSGGAGNALGGGSGGGFGGGGGPDTVPGLEGGDAAVQAGALKTLSQHLAAAPRLQLTALTLLRDDLHGTHLSLRHLADGLAPLAGRLSHLHWHHLAPGDSDGEWAALAAALPLLARLELVHCTLSDAGLAALAFHMTQLRRLDVHCMEGVTEEGGWVGFAAARAAPLSVHVGGALVGALRALCDKEQDRVHGRRSITWSEECQW